MDEDSIFPVVCRKRLANIIRSSPSPSHASIRWSLGLHSQTASIVKPLLTTFLALNRFPRMTFLKYKKDIFVPSLLTILHGLPISFRVKAHVFAMIYKPIMSSCLCDLVYYSTPAWPSSGYADFAVSLNVPTVFTPHAFCTSTYKTPSPRLSPSPPSNFRLDVTLSVGLPDLNAKLWLSTPGSSAW